MKKTFIILSTFVLGLSLLLTSCSDKVMGYSVVLWNIPSLKVESGSVVPVYIKSNISHVYVIGTPDGEKAEVPLWQLTEPQKKSKIKNVQAKYSAYANTYAAVKVDGLPARAEAVNTAKQVYRLRKGEVIKILYKLNGTAPMTGGKPLEGDWFRILTNNGTQACCFSYNLNLYQADIDGNQIGGEKIEIQENEDTLFEDEIALKTWYPDYYSSMIQSGSIDLAKLKPSYNFAIDTVNNKVTLNLSDIHESWTYDGYSRSGENEYELKGIPLVIIYKRSNFIVIRYTGSSGKPQDINLVILDADLNQIIADEKARRLQEYKKIYDQGPVFESDSYGKITFNEQESFYWSNFKLLVPSVIPKLAKGSGSVSVKYVLGKALQNSYDGVITFKFQDADNEVNFLYKIESNGLRLEDATGASFNGNQLYSRGSSPIIIFFRKK